jgi:phosphoribosylaminoimidazolecarboxamide formyltransferase/IMP cyclohydrolase
VLEETKFALAVAAFNRIADYDAAISDYLSSLKVPSDGVPEREEFPAQANGRFVKLQDLRYGENPHQSAAFYRDMHPAPGSLVTAKQLQGKELSYNNIADADAAWECVKSFGAGEAASACVIVKHANPCGVALGASSAEAYAKAFKTDPTSAFGGIIAFNIAVDKACAEAVARQFVEVLIAPAFSAEALAVFAAKPNARLLQIDLPATAGAGRNSHDTKRVGSGLLIQTADNHEIAAADLKVVTTRQPTPAQLQDLLFAWKVAKYVKSNAIVFCAEGMTLGVGAGQMSRLDSARIARIKAEAAGLSLAGSAVASDAFFPFRDGLDVVIDVGATSVIQPGGSMCDDEVIAAANERDIAMVFTGVRHFRH